MSLIKQNKVFKEGDFFNKFLELRTIRRNKNVLSVTTGATGSGKSYQDLRRFELWYKYHFKEEAPIKHVCFSIAEAMKLLASGNLRKGDIIIIEEAGANLGSLDFQTKVSKMFNYVMQSFRSLNIVIFFNLPYIDMLNKQIRQLIHVHFQTHSIDNENKIGICKAYYRQVNQHTGKIYPKWFRTKVNGKVVPIKKIEYGIPSERLVKLYEEKKKRFVMDLASEFSEYLDKTEKDNIRKLSRKMLTEKQQEIYELRLKGLLQKEIGDILSISQPTVNEHLKEIEKKGYRVSLMEID